ncbi:MAG: pyridoxamine 5'-phosphate oxidase [Propionicimonas sp.]
MDLRNLRTDYDHSDFTEAADAPLEQFERWLAEAVSSGMHDPHAMTLATVGPDGRPSTRVVLLKSVDAAGLVWFTNYRSRKARELDANPFAAVQFHWPGADRVVRVEGRVTKVSEAESDEYFAMRPLDSRIGAWASPQSEVISSRAVLLANAAAASAKYGLRPPRPEHWGGYRLASDYWEFWQGRRSRLHDRIRYRLVEGVWVQERLAP